MKIKIIDFGFAIYQEKLSEENLICGIHFIKVVDLLLNANANPNIQDMKGATPLHHACEDNNTDITDLLLKAGANCNCEINSGETPLHIASYSGYPGIVDLLLKAKSSNPDLQSSVGGFTKLSQ